MIALDSEWERDVVQARMQMLMTLRSLEFKFGFIGGLVEVEGQALGIPINDYFYQPAIS